jgi:hypothetical protein
VGVSHQARLAAIVAAPSKLDLGSSRDGKVLSLASDADLATLRATATAGPTTAAVLAAGGGPVEYALALADRVSAVLALVWLGDPAAGEALAAVLDAPECADRFVSKLTDLGRVAGVFDGHRALLEPWLVARLGSPEQPATRAAGWACGRLRVAPAGPRLLALARETFRPAHLADWPWDSGRYLAQAARCWPSQEVLDEIRGRAEVLTEGTLPIPSLVSGPADPGEAVAEMAASAPVGRYEWALEYSAAMLRTGAQQYSMLGALEARAPGSIPLIDEIVCTAPGYEGPGSALGTLATVAPELADRRAREHWRRFPSSALEVFGRVYRGTGDPGVIALVSVIAAERPLEGVDCVDALLWIGGDEALRAATGLMASLPAWIQGRGEVERRLERKLARAAQ